MLESITIQGFKSFAERTRLEFGPGISAVIGPNGSGKSNVVEALRWAAQQARARELRASKATELIFHGSGGKAPLGLAEVQLELSTPAGQLSVGRRLYRDGSAEQDLAGRPARVRDIHQALRGTGLGPGGLAVIGQGEVAGVVQAEGKTLLGYLQEAAGLSRAVSAREDTEQRLGQADRALREVQLIADELGLRVRDLAQAAAAAQRHRDLSLRELALTEALRRHRQLSLGAELSAARRKISQLSALSAELAVQTAEAAAQLEASQEALRAVREVQASHHQALELLRAAQDALSQARRVAAHLQRERANLEADLAALSLPPPTQADGDPAPLQGQLNATRADLTRAEAQRRRLGDELTRAQRQQAQQAEAATRFLTQRDTLDAELMELAAGQAQRSADLAAARADLAAAAAARQQAAQLAQQLSAAREDLSAQQRRVHADLAALRAARPPLLREQSRLDESLRSHSRYGEGPRRALGSGHPGLVGSVADVLSVSAEYEVAATAALGRRLEQVVVRRTDDAREIIDLLKRQGGRATFLPLELLRPRPRRDAALLRDEGVLGNLAELCPSDPPQVAEALLADTLLVRDLAAATRLARQYHSRPRLVTLEGELLEPGGALTGGRLRDGGANLLADQRRAHDLSAELSDLARQETQLQASEQALGEQLAALPAAPAVSEQAERQAERRLTQLETAQQAAEQRRQVLEARLAGLALPVPTSSSLDPVALETQLAEIDAALTGLRQQERAQTEALAAARELAAQWTRHRAAAAQRTALETRLSANAAALSAQLAEQQLAEAEALRRQRELGERRPAELPLAEQTQQAASRAYANLLARQNAVRAELEDLTLSAARREGSLEVLPDGALLPASPREWNAELLGVREQLAATGPVNALAEAEHAEQAARLAALTAECQDAERATAELRLHLSGLARDEAAATAEAYGRVNAAFADYSRELLGGEGQLEADYGELERLTGLRLTVQPQGKRTRSLTLLSAGERTMAGLGFLFALGHASASSAGGLPLAVLDEVDAPLDEANIRRFTHFLKVFAARGAQFVLVTHQKATMEVAQAIWGVTTEGGASRVLSIKQREAD